MLHENEYHLKNPKNHQWYMYQFEKRCIRVFVVTLCVLRTLNIYFSIKIFTFQYTNTQCRLVHLPFIANNYDKQGKAYFYCLQR